MIKKINIVLLAVMWMVPLISHAQFMGFSIKSNNQIFIEKALEHTFVKIEQSYQLQDTVKNEIFGRNGENYFSIIPFLGIRTQQGILIHQNTVRPWEHDEDFKEYERQYQPVIFQTKFSDVHPQVDGTTVSTVVDETKVQTLKHSPFALYKDSLHLQGLICDTIPGKKSGWFVWIIDSQSGNNPDSIRIMSYKKELYITQANDSISIDSPNQSQPILGGLFVSPVQTGIGQITFLLTGVAVNENGTWKLHFPFFSQPIKEEKELTIIKSERKQNKLPKINTK